MTVVLLLVLLEIYNIFVKTPTMRQHLNERMPSRDVGMIL